MSGSKEQSEDTQEAAGTTTALGAGQAMPTSGCSPASLNSPMSSCGSRGSFECGSLEKFMEAWGALSPEGQQLAEKRQGLDTEHAAGGTYRRRRSSSPGGTNFRPISSGGNDGYDGYDVTSAVGTKRRTSSASSGFQSPSGKYGGFSDFMLPMTTSRRSSPSMLDPCSSISIMGDGGGSAAGSSTMGSEQQGVDMSASASLSRSPKRKRSNEQLAPYVDENGAPSPFPSDGGSKNASQVLSNSSLTVQNDGAYMQITYDESHRFAADEEPGPSGAPQASAWGESLMNDPFLATPEHHHPLDHPRSFERQSGQRRDIDQALSLLQLSVGSASGDGGGSGLQRHNRLGHLSMSTRPELRNVAQGSSDIGIDKEGTAKSEQHFMGATAPPESTTPHAAEAAPLTATEAPQALALTPAPSSGDVLERNPWLAPEPKESHTGGGTLSQPLTPPIPKHPGAVETAEARAAAWRLFSPPERRPPPGASRPFPATRGESSASALLIEGTLEGKIIRGAGSRGGVDDGDARGDDERDMEAFEGGGVGGGLSTRSKGNKLKAKAKGKGKGAVGGQRPAVQAPVSTPRGTKGGGPGSFCSKPEALSQLDTSQSDLMVLDADLWIVRDRGDVCSSDECIYKDKHTGVSSRRHYHATCDHRHKGGPKGGMIFHHHQLEKIQKHQRAHIRTLHKKTPAEAVLTGANVEPYLPDDWTDHETKVLEHLVGLYGSTSNWNVIAAGVASKSETQCMLHWRFALNGNATVKGTGTWQPVEDERMLSLVQVFGQRWSTVAEHMPGRLAKQCRERYLNNLDPELRRGTWSREEDEKLLTLRGQQNKSFAKIAEQIDGRSYNDVKNRWSQISRQIASLKKTSGKKGRRLSPKTLAAAAVFTNTTTSANANANVKTPEKLYLGRWRDAGGLGDCSPKSDASETSREGAGPQAKANAPANALAGGSKYRVCMNGGIPTLQESSGAEEDERVSEEGNEVGHGKLQQQQQPLPPPLPGGSSGARDRGQGPPSSRSSSDSGSSPGLLNPHHVGHHDAFIGMRMDGTLVGVHEEAKSGMEAEAAPDFVGPMSDAGGTLFVFGNDMRVSI